MYDYQMHQKSWTEEENDKCVSIYFEMLGMEITGKSFVKAQLNRLLQQQINRNHKSIEYKFMNVSAVMRGLGHPWVNGYRPAKNFQLSLVDAVMRQIDKNPWLTTLVGPGMNDAMAENQSLWIGKPPSANLDLNEEQIKKIESIARKFDVAGRDERNRKLGRAGEERVFFHERHSLQSIGRDDLARKVRWVSQEDGDGAGYDILSFGHDGKHRFLEVKTTNGWDKTPFHISKNEIAFAEENRAEWHLFRLWNFSKEAQAFELTPPLEDHVRLTAESFRADFP